MRSIRLVFSFVAIAGLMSLRAQTPTPPPPQSARQALLEMFFGKGENDFQKHLPEDARQILIRKGETPETSTILRISTFGRQMVAQGERVETFDTGPVLLSSVLSENEKIEVNVEHDILTGEGDEIELSVYYYKNAQLQSLPVVPDLTLTLKQEKDVWRLTEVTAAAHIPLTDLDYLKGLRKQQNEATESQAKMRLTFIAAAETSYVAKHPDLGYTCLLPTLFARDPDAAPGEGGAFDPGQGSDEWQGYRFALTGCDGHPATKYRISAVPLDPDGGMKTFCTDESGSTKFVTGGKLSTCFSRGKPVNSGNEGTD